MRLFIIVLFEMIIGSELAGIFSGVLCPPHEAIPSSVKTIRMLLTVFSAFSFCSEVGESANLRSPIRNMGLQH